MTLNSFCTIIESNIRGEKFIRLPHAFRQALGIRRGDIVEMQTAGEAILLRFRAPNGSNKPKRNSRPYFPRLAYRSSTQS